MTSKHSSTIGVVATLAVVVSSLVVVVLPLASAFVATTLLRRSGFGVVKVLFI